MQLKEVDSNTLSGSNSTNLVTARSWALQKLQNIKDQFSTIYVLGSWYGNIGLMISMSTNIEFEKLINVDTDNRVLTIGKKLAYLLGDSRLKFMHRDANSLDYRRLNNNGLVINFSTTNIEQNDWFDHIPNGTMVVLKGRNNDEGAVNKFNTMGEFKSRYPLTKTIYTGSLPLEDRTTKYDCFLVIGIK